MKSGVHGNMRRRGGVIEQKPINDIVNTAVSRQAIVLFDGGVVMGLAMDGIGKLGVFRYFKFQKLVEFNTVV